MSEVFVDLRNDPLFKVCEKRVVAKTHEVAQRRCQVAGLTARLQPAEGQAPVALPGSSTEP